ncbi:putative indole-3-pyruvate monooxygenase YUCCA9 [Colletotrichum orbiculare MAFF 240422]|uniref:L-ornithine N(5)-monooxygenase [NAD(P)H] n=1 Tax=Colletotrichum orbiculare (strain 104-T / ATCC 96160 / CBS 514.97 / LARS 414 / MAFF 240422) TaxID=1213857 RepID=A0A484FDQ6_COLOR|nr:putative indole-3-pyruvate monooxygenase YUCCA9 [Colletotrichum orbiculare MAFF 240422]
MTQATPRIRVLVDDLHSWIPAIPPFEGEESINAVEHAVRFIEAFSSRISSGDWNGFEDLSAEKCFWRDYLTLTFDKRTLHTSKNVADAWKALSQSHRPSGFSMEKDDDMTMEPAWVRMSPAYGTLDVPFRFRMDNPKLKCIGLARLIPGSEGEGWKIYTLTTAAVQLEDLPFRPLPRKTSSLIKESQRGKSQAQGLPSIDKDAILDAVIAGGSCNGIATATMIDSAGADAVVFDMETRAGGNWSTKRYESVRLHHPANMVQLPLFPVPEKFPKFLSGREYSQYLSAAVENLQLPFFGGVEVVSNLWDEARKLWRVKVRDVLDGKEMTLQAKNLILATGFVFGQNDPKIPKVNGMDLFKGVVQHTAEYRTSEAYRGRDVLVVGSGNSAHDVAADLALNRDVQSVTLLQRNPTALFDYETVGKIIAMRYQGDIPVDTADFLEGSLPTGVLRDIFRSAIKGLALATRERSDALEKIGYMVDREPCVMTKLLQDRGKAFYIDHPKTFDLVFDGKINIARGEVQGFQEDGVLVADKDTGEQRLAKVQGVVLGTGYEVVDLPRKLKETGFLDEASAERLVNVSMLGVDKEGEIPGLTVSSGHPNLYFSGFGLIGNRTNARFVAIQVLADVTGQFPEKYPPYVVEVANANITGNAFLRASIALASFDFRCSVVIKVKYAVERMQKAVIRPLSLGISAKVEGGDIAFTSRRTCNVMLEINDDKWKAVQSLTNEIDDDDPTEEDTDTLGQGSTTDPPTLRSSRG